MTTWIMQKAPPQWVEAGYPVEEVEVYGRCSRLRPWLQFCLMLVADNDNRPGYFVPCERLRTDEEAAP